MTELNVRVDADMSGFRAALGDLEGDARRVGDALGAAFKGAAVEGRSLGDVLRDLALKLASIALDGALAPIEKGIGDALGRLAGDLVGALAPAPAPGPSMRAAAPVTFNVTTPDAESFRRAEGQIAAMVARSAMRGRRSL